MNGQGVVVPLPFTAAGAITSAVEDAYLYLAWEGLLVCRIGEERDSQFWAR
jgi:hypothetical protein